MYFVFPSINYSLLFLNQLDILFISNSHFKKVFDITMISKKICIVGKHYWLQNIRSIKEMIDINNKNKIDPCGTPHVISRLLVLIHGRRH